MATFWMANVLSRYFQDGSKVGVTHIKCGSAKNPLSLTMRGLSTVSLCPPLRNLYLTHNQSPGTTSSALAMYHFHR